MNSYDGVEPKCYRPIVKDGTMTASNRRYHLKNGRTMVRQIPKLYKGMKRKARLKAIKSLNQKVGVS